MSDQSGRVQSPRGHEGATWRDPLDWWFLSSGVVLRAWCSLWAGISAAHAEWRSWGPGYAPKVKPTVRQVGTLADALPCGCIPYEHETYGACTSDPASGGAE